MNKKYERLNRRVTLSPIEGITRAVNGVPTPGQSIFNTMLNIAESRNAARRADLAEGLVLKDEGQAAATAAALPWHEQGMRWIASQKALTDFTADDVIEAIGLPTGYLHTNWNNAVGALFTAAHKAELIRRTTTYVKSTRKSNHARVIAVWVRTGHPRG